MRIKREFFTPASVLAFVASIAVLTGIANIANAESNPPWGPTWTNAGDLVLPPDYHEWVFLGSPLTPNAIYGGKTAFPEYHNVYVQPEACAAYRKTGIWPEGTILIKAYKLRR